MIDFINKVSCGDPSTIQMGPRGSAGFLTAFKTIDFRSCIEKTNKLTKKNPTKKPKTCP